MVYLDRSSIGYFESSRRTFKAKIVREDLLAALDDYLVKGGYVDTPRSTRLRYGWDKAYRASKPYNGCLSWIEMLVKVHEPKEGEIISYVYPIVIRYWPCLAWVLGLCLSLVLWIISMSLAYGKPSNWSNLTASLTLYFIVAMCVPAIY